MQSNSDISMRPDDGDAFRQALRLAQQRTDLPVVFGGPVQGGVLNLTQFIGVRTTGLRGLNVIAATGLGGHVLQLRRPAAVADYRTADSITHDYDAPVLAERIRSVVAVPVVVSGAVRGVLYGASRGPALLGDRVTDAVVGVSRQMSSELAVRDEVDRRLKFRQASEANKAHITSRVAAEEVREVHAELRVIAQAMTDDALRDRLLDVSRRLAGLGAAPEPTSPLSPREIDVLAQVALGCSNTEVGSRLSLRPETVKAYLRSAMRKLDARTRFEAVVAARRRSLLP
ncbi:LuxR C-terminal-related transcriptional regulator [Streptomyces sp. NBC_00873]|uniref:helix-turn-helix transcriptional regulator n=1 Tax=unclassified Streptomyces TaxID=2593676 RepID=UPI003867D425|nr:LuxR C-terminal-related transcriptional regulator [Streptomyces sp. NBC_00873]WTA46420.1 LuxR C-terminal-related transcriptional regulator [Streptomyces sp. NBC_00842]